ncbi:MAG TPA: transposase [Dissulfurispiraceae bacterium]|nr:transposase [Dissulfurispiraceae bacterium]
MPRQARTVIAQCAHHVTQRGGNRQDVFFVDADRRAYLQYLREAAGRYGLRIEGYCLMTSHVHLIVEPQEETSLAEALKRTNQLYAQYVSRMHRRHGHFWHDRLGTSRGRPLGSDAFIAELETFLGRRLRAMPRGRPPRQSKNPPISTNTQSTEGDIP